MSDFSAIICKFRRKKFKDIIIKCILYDQIVFGLLENKTNEYLRLISALRQSKNFKI